jgi:hypothetical protein
LWEQLLEALPKLLELRAWNIRIKNASATFAKLARACAAKQRCLKLVCGLTEHA